MLNLRFIYFSLLIPLFCMAFDSAYADSEPEQAIDSKENQPSASSIDTQAPVSPSTTPTSILEILELPTDFKQTAALYALLSKSGIEELKQFVLEAKTIMDTGDGQTGLSIIYGRFADLDPHQALSHLLSAKLANSRSILSSMFISWSRLDLTEAIKQSQNLSNPTHQQIALQAILRAHQDKDLAELEQIAQRLGPMAVSPLFNVKYQKLASLAQINPQVAMKEALQAENPGQRDQLVHTVAKKWATEDPIAAFEYGEDMKEGAEKRVFRGAALSAVAQQDPEGILDLLDSGFVGSDERWSLIIYAMNRLVQIDPQYALEKAQSLSREQDRIMAINRVLSDVAHSDMETAIEMFESLRDPSTVGQVGQQVIEQFVRSDPERALKWAEIHSAEPKLLYHVITAIASSDPEHALELIADLPSSPTKSETLLSVVATTARYDPLLAASYLNSIPKGPVHQQVARNIARPWLRDDLESALAWIFSLDKQMQSLLLIEFAPHVMANNLTYAQNLLSLLPSAHVRRAWISAMVHRLPQNNDPVAAVEWLEQYKEDPKYSDWMNQLLGSIARTASIEDAIQLAENISGQAEYDSAMLAIVNTWLGKDFRGAANWVQNESETSNRNQLIQAVVGGWSANDVKSAQQWVMKFKDSAQRDTGLSILMANEYISSQDADNISRKMISPTIRFNALKSYIGNVAKYDSSAARLFLKRQIVLSDQKDALLKVIENIENGID